MIWAANVEDRTGKKHRFYLDCPDRMEENVVMGHAKAISRNWTLLGIEKTNLTCRPADAKPIPDEAHQHGVLKQMHEKRRR